MIRTSVMLPSGLIDRATKLRVRGAKILPLAAVLRAAAEQGIATLEASPNPTEARA